MEDGNEVDISNSEGLSSEVSMLTERVFYDLTNLMKIFKSFLFFDLVQRHVSKSGSYGLVEQ
jgi:hypothetical protein